MSNFPIQKQTYDPIAIDLNITQFENELDDVLELNKTLNDNKQRL